jgi:biopolymer transport protein TolQ
LIDVSVNILAIADLSYVWEKATIEGKGIILILGILSAFAWSVMAAKVLQIRRAKKLNEYFNIEFKAQPVVFGIFDRRILVEGCPLFTIYREGAVELDQRLRRSEKHARADAVSLKQMEHVKGTLERTVSQEALKLESGLILLGIAVSGAPFLGLLGTVWGVMSVFSQVAQAGQADLATMAPGLSAAMMTTVAGLLVAIPSMFGYNWLVHNLRVCTVELDNFAQVLVSRMETEFFQDDGENLLPTRLESKPVQGGPVEDDEPDEMRGEP